MPPLFLYFYTYAPVHVDLFMLYFSCISRVNASRSLGRRLTLPVAAGLLWLPPAIGSLLCVVQLIDIVHEHD